MKGSGKFHIMSHVRNSERGNIYNARVYSGALFFSPCSDQHYIKVG